MSPKAADELVLRLPELLADEWWGAAAAAAFPLGDAGSTEKFRYC
jgi:hypothetical protein